MPEPGAPRFHHPVAIRFRDLDPMGHVHHSLALIYFEEARAAYWRDVAGQASGGDGGGVVGYVIGEFAVKYLARVHFPQTLDVGVRVSRLGSKSWDMEYELRALGGALVARGHSVQVMYDYAADASVPVPEDVRRRIAAYEGLTPS